MSERTITIPDRAVPKARPRVADGHAYTPARTRTWEEQVAWQWRMTHRFTEPYTGRLEFVPTFNFAKRPYAADVDNLVKACSDAIEGLAYENDRQIDHIDAWRRKAERDSVTITVRELGEKTETAAELRASRERLRAVAKLVSSLRLEDFQPASQGMASELACAFDSLHPGDLE